MKKDVLTIFFVIMLFSMSLQQISAESDTMISAVKYDDGFYKGKVQWAEKCIIQGSTSTVRVIDHDMNKTPEKTEWLDIRVWSDSDMIGTDLTVIETGNDTGVFEGKVFFSTSFKTNHRVQSSAGDTVYAKYVDVTLPNSHIDSEMIDSLIMSGLTVLEYQKHDHARYPSLILYDNPCVMEYREKYKDTNAGQFSIFYPSPLKQIEMGLQSDEIQCKESLTLITKHDGSPACVKPETKMKLFEYGWSHMCPSGRLSEQRSLCVTGSPGIGSESEALLPTTQFDSHKQSAHLTSIIQFGQEYDSKLLPVIYSIVIENADNLDEITFYKFQLLGTDHGNAPNNWDFVPRTDRIFYHIVDEHGTDVIDRTRMTEHYVINDVLRTHSMDCNGDTIHAESGPEITFPIIPGTSKVLVYESETGLYPDSNDMYVVEFASLYDIKIELPDDVTTISYISKPCKVSNDPDNKFAQYHKVIFNLEWAEDARNKK